MKGDAARGQRARRRRLRRNRSDHGKNEEGVRFPGLRNGSTAKNFFCPGKGGRGRGGVFTIFRSAIRDPSRRFSSLNLFLPR